MPKDTLIMVTRCGVTYTAWYGRSPGYKYSLWGFGAYFAYPAHLTHDVSRINCVNQVSNLNIYKNLIVSL